MLNEQHPEVAYPAAFVIDREGTVRFRRVDIDFRERPPVAELLAALRALPAEDARATPTH